MKTKRVIYLLAACFISSLFILQTACNKDKEEEEPPSGPEPVVLKDNANILDETTWEESYVSIDSSDYTVTFNNNIESANLLVGDIMASTAGNGLLRRVTSITPVKGEVIVETEQASMEDLIESGDVIFDTPLEVESATFNYPGISLKKNNLKQPGSTEFTITIDHIFDDDGNLGTQDDQVHIVGYITFDWSLITSLHYHWWDGLTSAHLGFVSDQVFELNISSEYGLNKQIELGDILFSGDEIDAGLVTIPIKPVFKLFLGVDVNANLTLSTGVYDSLHFAAGITYNNGWDPYCTFNNYFTTYPPNISVGLDAKAYIKPQMSILFYGVEAPYVSAEGYVRAHGQYEIPQWAAYVGYNIEAGAEVKILGYTLISTGYTLQEDEWLIIQGPTPTVKTNAITSIGKTTATGGGNVTDQGTGNVTERGVCWSTSHNPTISNDHSFSGSGGGGSFTAGISNLLQGTIYYVRAFATNSHGTDYGDEEQFLTFFDPPQPCPGTPTVTDDDGNTYPTVLIAGLCWMKENLNVGTRINVAVDQTDNGQIEKYSFNDNPANCDTYGGLYQWSEIMKYDSTEGGQGICPAGWHIPSGDEWNILTNFISNNYGGGSSATTGGSMKEAGTSHWMDPNVGATNRSGFTGLPGGAYFANNGWTTGGTDACFWKSTLIEPSSPGYLNLVNNQATKWDGQSWLDAEDAFSVRCIKNH